MTADDFEIQPRGARLFDIWRSKSPILTSMGAFDVEFHQAPDDELLRLAGELVLYVSNQSEEVLDKVYEHYKSTSEHRYWMKSCDVPVGLERKKVIPYLRSRTIVLFRDNQGVTGSILINPQWDAEHKINLVLQNGALMLKPL